MSDARGDIPTKVGEWQVACYESGTMIVTRGHSHPWLYVYGPQNPDEAQRTRDRFAMCEQLRDFLNGTSPRPVWLDDMKRMQEESIFDWDGSSITATGPMVDRNPPRCDWWQDTSDEAKNARARLIDRLIYGSRDHQQRRRA